MSTLRLVFLCLVAFSFVVIAHPAKAVNFQPVSPDELKMTAEPKAPGAPAIILFKQVDRDDRGQTAHEDVYLRIKILTEEGRKYADVEIPYDKQEGSIVNLHARTIKPDGTVVNFSGKVFDQTIVKTRGVKNLAKTFTLPDVQVGGIIEYYYTTDLAEYLLFDSHWILNDELFTKSSKFSLHPYDGDNPPMNMRWTWHNLPAESTKPSQAPNHVISMEVSNVPAFVEEDYMPPANELKSRVDFIYSEDAFENNAETYWKKRGKKLNDRVESFIGKRKAMEQAVSETVAAGDPPEVKLQKIYARVQQIRNTSFEAEKTEQEQKRAKEKEPTNVEEVWKKGYADGDSLTLLFLAMARAAGFEASAVRVSDRQRYFFHPETMDGRRLDTYVVAVKLNGQDVFFDPGTAFIPYGMLPWDETAVAGLRLDKDGGSWVKTSLPDSKDSMVQRKAELKLTETGELEGKVTVTFTGLEASQRRMEERLADETARKKYLEDELKGTIPVACDVELSNTPDWKNSTLSLVAEYQLKVPGWVSSAGRRALFPAGLFSGPEKHLFDHADRVQPIYFEFPFRRSDDIRVDLPLGWQVGTTPTPAKLDARAVVYSLDAQNDKGTLHVTRSLDVSVLLLGVDQYSNLRKIFQIVRTSDEEQIMLQPGS